MPSSEKDRDTDISVRGEVIIINYKENGETKGMVYSLRGKPLLKEPLVGKTILNVFLLGGTVIIESKDGFFGPLEYSDLNGFVHKESE